MRDRWVLIGLVAVGAAFPLLFPGQYGIAVGFSILVFIVLGQSWIISGGFTGYYSFGQGVFFGLGGYGLAIVVQKLADTPLEVTALLGALAGLAVAVLLALALAWVTLRIQAVYFSLATLMVLFLATALATKLDVLTNGTAGIVIPPIPMDPYDLEVLWYYIALVMAAASALGTLMLQRSGLYRRVLAIRDDEVVAETCGVSTLTLKVAMFALGAAMASVAGSAYFFHALYIDPTSAFALIITAYAILMPVFGGSQSWLGPIVGSVILLSINSYLTISGVDELNPVIFGLILMASVLVMRDGLIGAASRVWSRWRPRPEVPRPTVLRARSKPGSPTPWRCERAPGAAGDKLLECAGLRKVYGGVEAISDLTLTVDDRPQITAVIGANGAGKSTLFNLISGVVKPDGGRVVFQGEDLTTRPSHAIRKQGISRTYQDVRVFGSLSAIENVAVAASAGSHDVQGWQEALDAAQGALDSVGFLRDPLAKPIELNIFERKQVDVARALVTGPRLLLIDEFLAGIGQEQMQETLDLLRQLKSDGLVVLVIEHVMAAVMGVSERVVVLDNGRVIADGTPEVVAHEPQVVEAYLGAGWAGRTANV